MNEEPQPQLSIRDAVLRNSIRDASGRDLDQVARALFYAVRETGEEDEALRARLVRELFA